MRDHRPVEPIAMEDYMTTMTAPSPFETNDAAQQDLAEARKLTLDLLKAAGSDGMPLIEMLQDLTRPGLPLSAVTAAITEMLEAEEVDLTGDRRLRLGGSDQ
jgi:hypothetical protein